MKLKRWAFVVLAAVVLTGQLLMLPAQATEKELPLDDSVRLGDMVITALMPKIAGAVNCFYEPYLTSHPTVATYYDSQITQIRGGEQIHEGTYNSHYVVTVEVYPYIGPHLAVGKDRITMKLQPDGIHVETYEHLESYPLLEHYQSIVKKTLP